MFIDTIIRKIFGTKSEREIKKLYPIVAEINAIYEDLHQLSDEEIRGKTDEFRARIKARTSELEKELDSVQQSLREELTPEERDRYVARRDELEEEIFQAEQEVLDEIMPEAFAVVKEVCRRLKERGDKGEKIKVVEHHIRWDMIPFDVQLIGAIVLHQGKIAEMVTGEGKTLVATMPLYLNSLPGKGAHLVTVNDYLARRDADWMGEIYKFLGLSVGCIQANMSKQQRKEQYQCDITYGTNNEFGFDYLRDNMAIRKEAQVQRGYYYAIIDEVDSVLIDEARTPLIISGPAATTSAKLYGDLKPKIDRLMRLQMTLVNRKLKEAERLLEDSEELPYKVGELLVQAKRGAPKNKRLGKLFQMKGLKSLSDKVELDYLRDKKLHILDNELYFVIDEQQHAINLTDKGRKALSPSNPELFLIPDVADEFSRVEADESLSESEKRAKKEQIQNIHTERSRINHALSQLLKAYSLFEKDVDYVVMDGRVIIVDEFTGRLMPGRRYSDGLHQALEAKEGVKVEAETQTFATITLQNYFRMYNKLAGMTGTAATEASEFWEIYKLEVISIPTNKPVRRIDYDDIIYKTKREKYKAIIDEITRMHTLGRPVLVGTISVEVSETLSRMLRAKKIPHSVLNAKYHQKEAEIVALAGQPGSVTIATNMAGRGTDIKLGEGVVKCKKCCILCEDRDCANCYKEKNTERECVEDMPCGLHIIGTERHEARRIDLQLKGRSGRQGDPGSSKFYLSLEDDLMRLFGSERITTIMDKMGFKEGEPIKHPWITRAIEKAQKRVEAQNFSIRKHLLEYDDIMNRQREVIYSRRQKIIEGENLISDYLELIEGKVGKLIDKYAPTNQPLTWDIQGLINEFKDVFVTFPSADLSTVKNPTELERIVYQEAEEAFRRKLDRLGPEVSEKLLRFVMLATIGECWKEHLYVMDGLKEGISLRAYGQKDPLVEYKREAYAAFVDLLDKIEHKAVSRFFVTEVVVEPRRHGELPHMRVVHSSVSAYDKTQQPAAASLSGSSRTSGRGGGKQEPRRVEKVGRNDPCPCGSGKKYKHCCGRKKRKLD